MLTPYRLLVLLVGLVLAVPASALADETDNFTCRGRLSRDSLAILDAHMNSLIQTAIDRINQRGANCDARCLESEFVRTVGRSERQPITFIGHSSFARWIERQPPSLDRCRLSFRDSVYGARPYNQPWLFPFTGRIIFLADSILVSGRVIGIDKINHFMREGLKHWQAFDRKHLDLRRIMKQELGAPRPPFQMTEYGLHGLALTGVLAYADLAASYSGFMFWRDLLTVDGPRSFVARDATTARIAQVRQFTFADYVTDAWDESINRSKFAPELAQEVEQRLRIRGSNAADCRALTSLPDAELYVNPACFEDARPAA